MGVCVGGAKAELFIYGRGRGKKTSEAKAERGANVIASEISKSP